MKVQVNFEKKDENTFLYYFYDEKTEEFVEYEKKIETTNGKELFGLIEHCMRECLKRTTRELVIISEITTYRKFLTNLDNLNEFHRKKMNTILHLKEKFAFFDYQYKRVKKSIEEIMTFPQGYDAISYTDISSRNDTKQSSIAGILYDSDGNKIEKMTEKVSFQTNTTFLEAYALLEMMAKAKERKLNKVLFRIDHKSVEQLVKGKKKKHKYIPEIREMLENNPNWEIERVHGLQNKHAHNLSREVLR